jgi:hypothetical protein
MTETRKCCNINCEHYDSSKLNHCTTSFDRYTEQFINCQDRIEKVEREPEKPKELEKYRVVKPFSLYGIAAENPCVNEFLKLTQEVKRHKYGAAAELKTLTWTTEANLSSFPTLLNNLDWMERHFPGAIVKNKKETLLYPGMRVKRDYTYIVTTDFNLVNTETGEFLHTVSPVKTLEELNMNYFDRGFTIVKKEN